MKLFFLCSLILLLICCSENDSKCNVIALNEQGVYLMEKYRYSNNIFDLEKSINKFKKAIHCDVNNATSYKNIIEAYIKVNDIDSALIFNKKALVKKIDNDGFFVTQRASLFSYIGSRDSAVYYFDTALEIKKNLIKVDKKNIFLEAEILEILCKLNRKDAAVSRFKKMDTLLINESEFNAIKQIINSCDFVKL